MTPARRAFTMVEAAVSIVVVGVMLGAALETVGASRAGQVWNSEKLRAIALASALMGEITDTYYQDPASSTTLVLGVEAGENQSVRTTLNDVDDFNGIKTAPANRDGTTIPNLSNWSRNVTVEWVTLANPSKTSATETGLKRITVDVYRGSVKLATLVAFRSSAISR